ncbi:MAG: hypothetical protein P8J87_12660, partial [Verrucomicrobiales bacterium]|nr:hypothetical protein [Verrucomicrobiales bacterium]
WVKRLSALPIKALDEAVLADAFVRTHSQAEVYQLEDIERVFGETEKLKPATLAKLLTTMRSNLASLWRDPKVQAASKTKRKDKELQAEVARGYEVASVVLGRALERYPDAWELQLVKAAMAFDQNNYRKEQADDSGFTARKQAAFGEFARAAEMYSEGLSSGEIVEGEETGEIYTTWFYASLGASDLGALKAELLSDGAQQEAVKEAMLALPGEAAERHMARFANSLSMRMTSVKAEMKNRYLGAGLKISGDHKQAAAAKKLYDYYQDLVTEIQLVTRIDGSDVVGSGRPFGMFIDLKHTKMIEREAGGFSKYLTNQNNNPYAYNYGRPPENYRDKFEESAREALGEQFEVISVTFHSEKIQSRGVPEPGWRVTPYAYLLMKSRGSEVDTIPSLRMDLDFLDTSGYVVLPIESPKLPIDARGEAEVRPFEELTLTQTLDEREAADGKLLLEVKATARGLVPELESLLDVKSAGFSVEGVDDQGVSVIELDAESEENRAVSERNWVVELRAAEGEAEIPGTFTFAKAKGGVEVKEEVFQRYDDADMMMAEAEISLEAEYGEEAGGWVIPAVGVGVVLLGLIGWLLSRPKLKGDAEKVVSYEVPEEVTPFTVVALLRRIGAESNGNLGDAGRAQLDEAIAGVEASYFAEKASGDGVELRKIAEDWVRRAA